MPGADFTDVDPFFDVAEFGSAATWQRKQPGAAAVAGVVIIDAPGQLLLEGIASTEWSALYRVAQWPSVAAGDRVTVGTTIYEAREVLALDDGLLARAMLRRMN
ncbi:MAG: hypothetical protein O9345_16065 [Burkholderiaceae bacterium]|nr:hypothetical protein [Burkholderiales bacterium]MCZ8339641.1 hypothetical protein [Burkholderiaceae bacterium]